jgi:hypothetical protein
MRKSVRRLAPVVAIALIPMAAMTMPTASSSPCDDGQFWSPHASACEALPCPYGSSFDANADVCQCNFGWRYNPLRNVCQSLDLYAPPFLGG